MEIEKNIHPETKIINFEEACTELFLASFFDPKFNETSIQERAEFFGIPRVEEMRDIFEFPS